MRAMNAHATDRREILAAAGVLLALFAALYGRFLIGWSPAGGDIVNQYLPYQELIRNAVRAGDAPLWNSFTFLGRPLMADIQVGVLYPPNWLHWLLPLPVSFALVLALHGAWMIWGCWRLGRTWGLDPAATALGTVLFAAAPFFTMKVSTGVVLFTYVGAWWPWLALGATRLARRPGWSSMVLLAVALALSLLAGSPQLTFYGWLMTLAVGLTMPAEEEGGGARQWWRRTGWLAGAFAAALGLTAVQTFQTAHFIGASFERGAGTAWDYITDGSLAPRLLWLLVNPGMLGVGSSDRELYWGGMVDYAESCFYVPLWVICVLLPVAWAAVRKEENIDDEHPPSPGLRRTGNHERQTRSLHRRLGWLGAVAMALGVLLAMGRHSYTFRFFFEFVPVFDRFRVPMRMMVFWSAGLAALAALAGQSLPRADADQRARMRWAATAGGAAGLALIALPWLFRRAIWSALGSPFLDHPLYGETADRHLLAMAIRCGGGLALSIAVVWFGFARSRRPAGAILALAVLAGAELAALAWPFQIGERWSRYDEAFYPRTPLIEALAREHRGGVVLWTDDTYSYLTDQNQPEALTNRLVMQGLPQARGYDPVNARWVGEWFNLLAGFDPGRTPGGFMFVPRIALPPWLTLMGIESVIAYQPLDAIDGLRPVERFAFPPDPQVPNAPAMTLTLWRNERFAGRAFAAPAAPLAEGRWSTMQASRIRAAEEAIDPLEALAYDGTGFARNIEALRELTNQWPRRLDGRYRVEPLASGPNEFNYRVDYPAPALLCLAQSAYGGWRATIDGAPAPLLSNYCGAMVVVGVPAGEHAVEFRYVPEGLATGGAVSAITLLLMALGMVRGRKRT
jgi:hypothetical protein